jgi:hypothetical protein
MSLRRTLVAAIAASAAFAVGTPAAGAAAVPVGQFPIPAVSGVPIGVGYGAIPASYAPSGYGATTPGPCSSATGNADGEGGTGRTTNLTCQGAGNLSFVGPSIGQVATIIGPTIIGPAFVGNSIVSAGDGGVGP